MMNKDKMKDKVRGCFLGVAIGDAIGKPVESKTPQYILEKYRRIEKYVDCDNHKYFDNDSKGTTTDDWQLTKAIIRAFISTGKFDLDAIAHEHVVEYKVSVRGWGGSTRESVARLAEGVHWSESGKTDKDNRGLGNGISMKVAPIGLYLGLLGKRRTWSAKEMIQFSFDMAALSGITHRTNIAATSGMVHAFAILDCFNSTPENFNSKFFIKKLVNIANSYDGFFPNTNKDDLRVRLNMLYDKLTPSEIIDPDKFGGGSCYVYDSLPFTYAWFLRNPNSIESLYDCVSSGSDADTTSSILGSLLGALHGMSIFPQHLIEGLVEKDEVLDIADKFYEKFK